jgi:hypothetical protein
MEGWRQGRPGSNVRIHRKKKEKTRLTHTGLLMEGVDRRCEGRKLIAWRFRNVYSVKSEARLKLLWRLQVRVFGIGGAPACASCASSAEFRRLVVARLATPLSTVFNQG